MDIKTDKRYRQDFWKGTHQAARLLNELKPDYVQVDERTLADLVKFTDQYARHIVFHRGKTAVLDNGTWQEFLLKDYLYLLFFISSTETDQIRTTFLDTLYDAQRFGGFEYRRKKCVELLRIILRLATDMNAWHENMELNDHTEDLVMILRDVVEKELKPHLTELRVLQNTILTDKNSTAEARADRQYQRLEQKLKLAAVTDTLPGITDEMLNTLSRVFNRLFFVTDHLTREAKKTLDKVLAERRDIKSHMALFIAFLRLYKKAQGEMNQITRKHLEFYYNRILGQSPDDTLPDQTYVCLTLAKKVDAFTLKKNTCFTAGKDSAGKNLLYRVQADTLLTSANIAQVHTLFVSKNPLNYTGLSGSYVSDIFYKTDVHLPEQPAGWSPFGEDQFFKGSESKTMENAPVGFVVASDALHVTGGDRDIVIDFECTPESYQLFKSMVAEIAANAGEREPNTFTRIFLSAFDFYLTLNGTETPMDRFAIKDKPERNAISLHLELGSMEGPLKGLTVPGLLPTAKPYVKLLLRSESHIYAYPLIQALKVNNVHIHTAARNIRELDLYNHLGQINPAVPFQVFGALPQVGAYFAIGSGDIFTKYLTDLSLKIKWFQLPADEGGWGGYFKGYNTGIGNTDYKVRLTYLKEGHWYPAYADVEQNLFDETTEGGMSTGKLAEKTVLSHIPLQQLSFAPYKRTDANPLNNKTRNGYLKLEFISPGFAFGHADYAKKLSEVVQYNSKLKPDDEERKRPEPAPPFSPLVENVEVNYRAETSAFQDDKVTDEIDLYQVTPFGFREVGLKSPYVAVDLLETYDDEGNLFIGLDAYPAGGYISLFFHLMEGRVEDYLREIPEPRWQYLANNQWHDFEQGCVIADGTNGFVQSGIVQLQIPDRIQNHNTLFNGHHFWIKASVHEGAQVAAGVNGIFTNAVLLQWDGEADISHLDEPLPAYSIKKLKDKVPEIKEMIQPLASFGAKKVEETNFFYQRVSERLRHKHRAVNVWDYERLVLDQFPILHKVKCFTANSLYTQAAPEDRKYLVPPGSLKIVVIPDINSPEVRNILRPKVGIGVLARIQTYLKKIASPFAEIEVMNPFYERVKVIGTIKLKNGLYNEGYYRNLLEEELKSFLTPWLWDKNSDNEFGNSVFESRIMSFVQGQPYVDFVTGFSVVKTWNDDSVMGLTDSARQGSREELKPLYPWSILVSADAHDITVIRKESYVKPEPRGIENMLLGSDFIITE